MADLYRIRNWEENFENNRTRELKRMPWVPIPTDLSNDSYIELIEHKNGAAHFGVWIACVEVAANSHPRGTLTRNGGTPHDSFSLHRRTRIPQVLIEQALERLCSPPINWIECVACDNPAGISQEGAGLLPLENRTEEERTEQEKVAQRAAERQWCEGVAEWWNKLAAHRPRLPSVQIAAAWKNPDKRKRLLAFREDVRADERLAGAALKLAADQYADMSGKARSLWNFLWKDNRSKWIAQAEDAQ